jgi:hypothetical protein
MGLNIEGRVFDNILYVVDISDGLHGPWSMISIIVIL